jgi:O-Antigen ligase.
MDINYNKQKINIMNLSIICISIYIFFWTFSIIDVRYFLYLSIILAVFNTIINKFYIVINRINGLLLIIAIYSLISLFYTKEVNAGLRFVIILFFLFFYLSLLIGNINSCFFSINIILSFALIHVIMILLQFIIPSNILVIANQLLTKSAFQEEYVNLSYGYYSGIAGFNSMAGFFSAIVIGIIFPKFVFNRNEKINGKLKSLLLLLITVSAFFALILTEKRGIFIAAIISFFVIMILSLFRKNKKIFLISIILILFFFIILNNSKPTQELLNRFLIIDNDFTSGRDIIYKKVFESSFNNILLGNGIGSVYGIIAIGAHNIYLQILCDNGIIGLILYFIMFIYSLRITILLLYNRKNLDVKEEKALYFSLYLQILFLIYGFTGNPLYDNYIFFIYIISISIPISIKRKNYFEYFKIRKFRNSMVGS